MGPYVRFDWSCDGLRTGGSQLPQSKLLVLTNRVYVDTGGFAISAAAQQVIAFDATTGVRVWSTPLSDGSRLLSIDSHGRVLVSVERTSVHSLRAIDSAGEQVWRFQSASALVSARELSDGTVAAVLQEVHVSGRPLLTRFDPRRTATTVRVAHFGLSRSRIPVSRFRRGFPACTATRCDFRRFHDPHDPTPTCGARHPHGTGAIRPPDSQTVVQDSDDRCPRRYQLPPIVRTRTVRRVGSSRC